MKRAIAIIILCLTLKGCIVQHGYKAKEPLEVYGVGKYDTIRFADIPVGEKFYIFDIGRNNQPLSKREYRGLYINNYVTIILHRGAYVLSGKRYISRKKYKLILYEGLTMPSLFYYNDRINNRSSGYDSYRSIQTGPRGGRYYINSRGNKTYIKR